MLRTATWIGLLATALLAVPTAAQMAELDKIKHTTPEQRAEFLTKTMTSELTLTTEQVPEVQAWNLKYAKLQQPLLEEQGQTFARIRQMRKLNSEKETSLQKMLNEEQWAKYEKGRAELKQKLETWASTQGMKAQP